MSEFLTNNEINQFNKDGAIFLKGKFDVNWIEKLNKGIERDIKKPSPRFKSHTLTKGIPAYLEDYWTWDLVPELLFRILTISKKSFLTVGSPPVNLILHTPSSDNPLANFSISSAARKVLLSLLSF
jgi:hypothetical protein